MNNKAMHNKAIRVAGMLAVAMVVGCQGTGAVNRSPRETTSRNTEVESGLRTYYIDGAGNWGYGVREMQAGLAKAGYRGEVVNYRWSPTLNPALDQTIGRSAARKKGQQLGEEISQFLKDHANADVNIIALSAGTGVAVWACEALTDSVKINNLVLLGSSLSSTYDMKKAMANIAGRVTVYHSDRDAVLNTAVKMLGTIDGQTGVASAGSTGLKVSRDLADRVDNIGWSPRYERQGWHGGHTDVTSESFVVAELARHIVSPKKLASAAMDDDSMIATR